MLCHAARQIGSAASAERLALPPLDYGSDQKEPISARHCDLVSIKSQNLRCAIEDTIETLIANSDRIDEPLCDLEPDADYIVSRIAVIACRLPPTRAEVLTLRDADDLVSLPAAPGTRRPSPEAPLPRADVVHRAASVPSGPSAGRVAANAGAPLIGGHPFCNH
jgi:hypothetical protein